MHLGLCVESVDRGIARRAGAVRERGEAGARAGGRTCCVNVARPGFEISKRPRPASLVKCDQKSVITSSIIQLQVDQVREWAIMRITSTLKLLLLTALTSVTLAQGSPPSIPPAQLTLIVENMERAQSEISIPSHVVREYQLSRPNSAKVSSYVTAEADFRPPGRYAVKKRSGSSLGEVVVRRILKEEVDIAVSMEKSAAAAVTQNNYVFSYLGDAVLEGHSYYLLRLNPKRNQPELVSGQAWVDQHSFLIRRIEGKIAKSPSWWVKKVQVELDFSTTQRMWVLSRMKAVAEVRCVGTQELTSSVLDYGAAVVVAAKTGDKVRAPAPLLAVALSNIKPKHK
jgi:hypothetical protein